MCPRACLLPSPRQSLEVPGAGQDSGWLLLLPSELSKNWLSEPVAQARHGIPGSSGPSRHAGVRARAPGQRGGWDTTGRIQDTPKRCKEKNPWKLEFESPRKTLEPTCHQRATSSLPPGPLGNVAGPLQIAVLFRVGSGFPQLGVRAVLLACPCHSLGLSMPNLGGPDTGHPSSLHHLLPPRCFHVFLRPWTNI